MTQKFNLDAVLAERDTKPPFEFEFGGEDYTLPAAPDLRAFAALTAGRLDDGFRMLLGPEQWERLQASPATFDNAALEALITAYNQHVGADLGESGASATS